jgi:hypothetical protein
MTSNDALQLISRMMHYRVLLLTLPTVRFAALAPSRQGGRFGVFVSQRLYCVQPRQLVSAGN